MPEPILNVDVGAWLGVVVMVIILVWLLVVLLGRPR